jgi:hypothetical protein
VRQLFRRSVIAASVAALAVAPALGSGAIAGLQDDRLISASEDQIQARLDLLQSTGTRVTRVDVFWSEIAPTRPANPADPFDPAYKFSRLDQTLAGLASRNIIPILSIYSAPTWATGGKGPLPDGRPYNANMPDPKSYGRFVGAVMRRYNGLVNPVYAVQPRARHVEVWNEPNLSRYFVPQFDRRGRSLAPQNYMRLVKAAYTEAKAANPRAVVIAGVGGPKSQTKRRVPLVDQGHGALDWIRAMAKNKRMATFDAFSQHIYPAQPPKDKRVVFPNWASIPPMLREIDRIRPGLKLYITEAGYTTKRTPIRTSFVSEAKQATYLRHMMNLPAVRSKRVPVVIWFNMQDNPLWPAGLIRDDLTAKPSLAVFKGLAERDSIPSQLRP